MRSVVILKRQWRLGLNLITIGALVVLAYAIRHQLVETFEDVPKVKFWALLMLLPIEALNYHAQTRLYQKLFTMVDEAVGYATMLRVSIELNFVNHVFPSAGVSGISYFGFKMYESGIRPTKATLVQTMKLIMLFLSFEVLLFIGMALLAINGRANEIVISIGVSLMTLSLVGTAIFAYVIGSENRINGFAASLVRWLHSSLESLHIPVPKAIGTDQVKMILDEFHRDYLLFRSHYRQLRAPFAWALLANVTEILAVYIVYVAFGLYVNVGAIILAYAVANFAGLVSVLPGGVGIYEALMTGVLVAVGVPARISLPVTIMYRVLNTLLQVPPGYALYQRTLHHPHVVEVPNE